MVALAYAGRDGDTISVASPPLFGDATGRAWDPVARDRDTFRAWIREHVLENVATAGGTAAR